LVGIPLVTKIFKSEMSKSGHEVSTNLCPHFAMTRAELFNVAKYGFHFLLAVKFADRSPCRIKKLKTFSDVMVNCGINKEAVGCEVCKPAIGSILASLWNEHVMNPVHHA
jgi:nitrite reductase (NAD(P)H)